MSDTHLHNTIAYMRRRVTEMQRNENSMWGGYAMLQGEQAQYAAEQCLEQAGEAVSETLFQLRGLEAEQNKRDKASRGKI